MQKFCIMDKKGDHVRVCVCVRERQTARVGEEMDSEETGVGYVLFRLSKQFSLY